MGAAGYRRRGLVVLGGAQGPGSADAADTSAAHSSHGSSAEGAGCASADAVVNDPEPPDRGPIAGGEAGMGHAEAGQCCSGSVGHKLVLPENCTHIQRRLGIHRCDHWNGALHHAHHGCAEVRVDMMAGTGRSHQTAETEVEEVAVGRNRR